MRARDRNRSGWQAAYRALENAWVAASFVIFLQPIKFFLMALRR